MINDIKKKKSCSFKGLKTRCIWKIIFIVIMVLLSGLYLNFAWDRYQDIASSEAVTLAQSLESLLHPEHIAELSGGAKDLEKPEYAMAKLSLNRLAESANTIHFAYVIGEQDGDIVSLLDSSSYSQGFIPPEQVYTRTDDIYREPFIKGQSILSRPVTDNLGTWISALVPIKSPDSGEVIAVFGIDYSASEWYQRLWNQMAPDMIIVLCLNLLVVALLRTWSQHIKLKELNKRLVYDESLYHSVFDQAPIGIAIVNDKSFVLHSEFGQMNINPEVERILGRKRHELTTVQWTEITHPNDLQTDLDKFEKFKTGKINGYTMEKRFLRPDGSSVWTNMKVSPLLGKPDHSMHICLLEDISARKEIEESLIENERSKSVLLSHLPGLAYRCNYDREWTMQYVSDGCMELTGYPPESLLYNKDLSFNDLIAKEYRKRLWIEWKRVLEKRLPFKYEYEITTANGKRKWVLEMGQGIYDEQGKVEALEGIILDISDRKAIETALKYNSEHDRVTGLYNRAYLENLLYNDTKKQETLQRAVVNINLSEIQSLTAMYGFLYTQDLIKATADTLRQYCSAKCSLFYTYENRFVFYIKDYKDKNELNEFCKTVAKTLETLLEAERVGGGIGVIEIGLDNECDVDRLLKRLLIASERAINIYDKEFGICFYDTDMEKQINREKDIKRELTKVAENQDADVLFMQYQPIIDLNTNQICGFEALSRLKSDTLGLVQPAEFIPVAEKTKLIIPVGKKIMFKAFSFLKQLCEKISDAIIVSVNVSAIQLLTSDFNKDLFEMISQMQINPKNICIEITESIFTANYNEINNILGEIKEYGISIALDDFGTGYSSLSRERELNISCIKIDKYFIEKLMNLKTNEAITGDIISMAHKLGHYTIAEGVEHEKQLEYLQKQKCDRIQGFLISKPLDEDAAIDIVKNHG